MSGAARVAAPDFSRQIRNPQLMAAALALHDNRGQVRLLVAKASRHLPADRYGLPILQAFEWR